MKTGKKTPPSAHSDVATRLREFATEKYKNISGLCRALGKDTSYLNLYLSGKSLPGWKLQQRLRELGCDIEWLMTGNSPAKTEVQTYTSTDPDNPLVITSDDIGLLKAALLRMLKQMNVMEEQIEEKDAEIRGLKWQLGQKSGLK